MKHSRLLRNAYGEPQGIGDVDPLEYGGGLIYRLLPSSHGSGYELEYIEPPSDEEFDKPSARWTVYRVPLDRITDPSQEWWFDDIEQVMTCCDHPSLLEDIGSEDPLTRAMAYESIAQHHGWEDFDDYPLVLTKAEVNKRYRHVWRSKRLETYRRTGA